MYREVQVPREAAMVVCINIKERFSSALLENSGFEMGN